MEVAALEHPCFRVSLTILLAIHSQARTKIFGLGGALPFSVTGVNGGWNYPEYKWINWKIGENADIRVIILPRSYSTSDVAISPCLVLSHVPSFPGKRKRIKPSSAKGKGLVSQLLSLGSLGSWQSDFLEINILLLSHQTSPTLRGGKAPLQKHHFHLSPVSSLILSPKFTAPLIQALPAPRSTYTSSLGL